MLVAWTLYNDTKQWIEGPSLFRVKIKMLFTWRKQAKNWANSKSKHLYEKLITEDGLEKVLNVIGNIDEDADDKVRSHGSLQKNLPAESLGIDRGRLAPKHILAMVLNVPEPSMYQIRTKSYIK